MPTGGNFFCGSGGGEGGAGPVTSTGLCLADGTPIAVVATRDGESGEYAQEGWLNLVTGAWSAGAPPEGTVACGSARSITVSGTFCDVADDGSVAGLVLVEYQYGDDGSITTVRLVDAVTGETYTPTGEITTCPAGVEQPERDAVSLCDVADDGTVTPIVRDYQRDQNGAITGHADYTLDGEEYTPVGTVALCQMAAAGPCTDALAVWLCDVEPACASAPEPSVADDPDPAGYNSYGAGTDPTNWCQLATPGEGAPVWEGGQVVLGPDDGCPEGDQNSHRVIAARLTNEAAGDAGEVEVTASVRVANQGPGTGNGPDGRLALWDVAAGTVIAFVNVQSTAPVGHVQTYTVTGMVPAASLSAGEVAVVLDLETYQVSAKAWAVDQFSWGASQLPECVTQFRRTLLIDCETGETISQTDTTLDGEEYTPEGAVVRCTPAATGGGGGGGEAGPECAEHLLESCRWDDTDGDGIGDTPYTELVRVDCNGAIETVGSYTHDLTGLYEPVSPVDPPDQGAGAGRQVQAQRLVLESGASWDAAEQTGLLGVTAVARGGAGTITTGAGTSPLLDGESVSWSVGRDDVGALAGPLTIAADDGAVAVSWIAEVQ